MTINERFDACLNTAYRNRDESIVAALRPLRDDVTALVAERDELARKLAALTAEQSAAIRNAP